MALRWLHPVVWYCHDRCRLAPWKPECLLKRKTWQWLHSVPDAAESDPEHACKQRHADPKHPRLVRKSRNGGHRHLSQAQSCTHFEFEHTLNKYYWLDDNMWAKLHNVITRSSDDCVWSTADWMRTREFGVVTSVGWCVLGFSIPRLPVVRYHRPNPNHNPNPSHSTIV